MLGMCKKDVVAIAKYDSVWEYRQDQSWMKVPEYWSEIEKDLKKREADW